ncbi:MAG: ATP-binding cassette domain-containing protein [Roseburia sp.]|nr:ATP-binding cassette domain-containing protein [Roseburia sp.]
MSDVIMKVKNLRKVFGDFVANDGISFEVEAGKIYALAGENGAGKSTLMKMLYGVYPIDGGELYLDGEKMEKYSPSVAREKGIGMVFQDFRLVPAFTALENIFLSTDNTGWMFHKNELRKRMKELSDRYSLHVNPDEVVWRLDLGQRQHIEILKVLMNDNTRILIFDEPTSVLSPNEIDAFLKLLTVFRDKGFAILLITHKIHEIVQVADVVHILRKGRLVYTFDDKETFSEKEIVAKMIGDEADGADSDLANVQAQFTGKEDVLGDGIDDKPLLMAKAITIKDDYGRPIIYNADFHVSAGMILGVAGISGNGQRELTEMLYGIRPLSAGKLALDGEDISACDTARRLELGMRILSEDPIRDNLVPEYTVLEHMAISGFPYKKKGPMIDWEELDERVSDCEEIRDLNVPDMPRQAEKLSGGNIQRMVFARAVIAHPKVFIASYPSRGLDIATVSAVHETLERLKAEGAAVIFISEDLNELFTMSDRLIVLSENSIFGPYKPREFDAQMIGEVMLKGVKE